MARRAERGGERGWSLLQIASEAGVPRSLARAAVNDELIGPAPFLESDIVLLRVAAAVQTLPGIPGDPDRIAVQRRNKDAIRFARAILTNPRAQLAATVLVGTRTAWGADTEQDLHDGLLALYPDPVLVLPVAAWALNLPSRFPRTPEGLPHPTLD